MPPSANAADLDNLSLQSRDASNAGSGLRKSTIYLPKIIFSPPSHIAETGPVSWEPKCPLDTWVGSETWSCYLVKNSDYNRMGDSKMARMYPVGR